jgi:hypothetical protein
VKVMNEAEAAHEALQVSQASEESPRAKLNSLQSKAACTSDSVLGTASSGAAQTSQLVEIPKSSAEGGGQWGWNHAVGGDLLLQWHQLSIHRPRIHRWSVR